MNYPSFESLNIAPDFLRIGASAMLGLRSYGFLDTARTTPPNIPQACFEREPPPAPATPTDTRVYTSRYVGVTSRREFWVAQWRAGDKRIQKSFPRTDEGETAAAWARARALGHHEPEMRP